MALDFILSPVPWDTIFEDMVDEIPAGQFHLQSAEMAPRSVLPTEFILSTDNLDATVDIWINNKLIRRHRPRSRLDRIKIPLFDPPTINLMRIENGVDQPVHLAISATHIAKYMYVFAREVYEYTGFITEKFFNLLRSPWASFIAEYQMPWQRALPEVRSWRSMAVKFIANCLYNESGFQGGVTDLVTGFCQSTPVIASPVNPELWQPDLYQPQTSGHDVSGFDFHVWMPNLCFAHWLAFIKITNNVDFYQIRRMSEQAATIQIDAQERYEQHRFGSVDLAGGRRIDNLGPGCSVLGLIELLGCMDRIDVAVHTILFSDFAFCAWASTFDEQVESPGIGGLFFDTGGPFDTGTHLQPDETNGISTDDATDLAGAIALATEIRTDFNAHDLDAVPDWHHATGGSHQITAAVPVDLPTLITLCLDAQQQYGDHIGDLAIHIPIDDINTLDAVVPADQPTCTSLLNDMKAKLNLHLVTGHFDSIYDVDLLTDYWVGTPTNKRFDFGNCLDSSTGVAQQTDNASCCENNPDALVFSTLAIDESTTSAATPQNPLFGGDDPGLLVNPYFGV